MAECKKRSTGANDPSTSLLMTQLASDVMQSLAEQVLTVRKLPIATLVSQELEEIGMAGGEQPNLQKSRETLVTIDRKIKELVAKLQQN